MGALSDMADRECMRMDQVARNAADNFWYDYQNDKIIDDDDKLRELARDAAPRASDYPPAQEDFIEDFIKWIHRYKGSEPPQTFFVFYGFKFKNNPGSIRRLKRAIHGLGLEYRERMSTDNDFFMFRPLEHGPGLEIINTRHIATKYINYAISNIPTDSGEPLHFGCY